MTGTGSSRPAVSVRVWLFFVFVFALSPPFWVLGAIGDEIPEKVPLHLPASALMFVCPALAAALLLRGSHQRGATGQLARRTVTAAGIDHKRWYLPALLLMPGVMLLSYGVMLLDGTHEPRGASTCYSFR
ncbi:hypothetical protein [Cryptosporangium sp. NPDC048952]|uniref:hypothetical protein n=1 Tax=Cryptosporangium sp. NPDC048952 TaxID=3363961 RepID=UPI00371515E8